MTDVNSKTGTKHRSAMGFKLLYIACQLTKIPQHAQLFKTVWEQGHWHKQGNNEGTQKALTKRIYWHQQTLLKKKLVNKI